MRCPYCSGHNSRVSDSRLVADGFQVRRRRKCMDCARRFTTYESVEESRPRVVKRNGERTAFDRERLRAGILKALEKRPVPAGDVEAAIERIVRRLPRGAGREVTSTELGAWVMSELRALDHVAYVRFASVHRRFEDVTEFHDELQRLENEPSREEIERQIPLISRE